MRPTIAVLDYGIGNLRSAQKALDKVGANAHLTADHDEIRAADAVVLPGVGAFGPCMTALANHDLADLAVESIDSGRPFLGICVGMQMLYEGSAESPGVAGLGVLPGVLQLLPDTVKRPQMQWNRLDIESDSPMFANLDDETWMYFVHSYFAPPHAGVVATCDYGGPVTAIVARGNLWATQFHPEKSSVSGLQFLRNFVDAARTGTPAVTSADQGA